jgi:D-alanyl-D-alanine carboxypeptidase
MSSLLADVYDSTCRTQQSKLLSVSVSILCALAIQDCLTLIAAAAAAALSAAAAAAAAAAALSAAAAIIIDAPTKAIDEYLVE